MDLFNPAQMRALLSRHGFHFSKAKGQNFLTAPWVPEQIAERTGLDERCGVLEIGPGIGALTRTLCRSAGTVVAVEVDRSLAPILAETLGSPPNLTILWQDALKLDLAALVREQFAGLTPVACANLPYYITSPILSRLLEARCFDRITVMVQKEVAQRICAPAGSPNYSAFTVFCKYHAQPELLFDVPAGCFVPQPKVTSAVVRLTVRQAPVCEIADEALFFRVVRAGFSQRRKMLPNCLSGAFPNWSKPALSRLLSDCGLDPTVRAEALDIPAFGRIANELFRRASG